LFTFDIQIQNFRRRVFKAAGHKPTFAFDFCRTFASADDRRPVGDAKFGELKPEATHTISLSLFNPRDRSSQGNLQYT
jgi:hypothetical protein